MALRDQPYFPLYVQDFLTDEKLMECSASATGVYIRIMCVMHKSNEYGKILLKQKDKQTNNQIKNFALKLARHLPYDLETILAGITELCQEKCLEIEGDFLIQKRMVSDGEISLIRSESGRKGGNNTQTKNKKFAKAKNQANSEIENEYENESILRVIKQLESLSKIQIEDSQKNYFMYLVVEMSKMYLEAIPDYFFDKETDYSACLQIAYKIALMKKWARAEVVNGKMKDVLESWGTIIPFIKSDSWLKNRSLADISQTKEWQRLVLKMKNSKDENTKHSSEVGRTIEFDKP